MKLLAIDTSNQTLAVSVMEDDQILANFQLNKKANHSLTLMPAVEYLMASVDLTPSDLEKIVVAQGPGSYTGIRIAVTTAKTLADTLKIDLVAVSSLATVAANIMTDQLIIPLFDARRNNVYAGGYYWQAEDLVNQIPDQHISLENLLKKIEGRAIFVGETEKFKDQIEATLPQAKVITASHLNLPNAAVLAKLAMTTEKVTDLHNFVPTYLKRVEAEEKWLETHQAGDEAYVEKI